MIPRLLPLGLAAVLACPAAAADRSYVLTNFDRVRVDGPFDVRLTVGPGSAGRAEGEQRTLDGVEVAVQGGTLTIRRAAGVWGQQEAGSATPVVVTVSTPQLRGASVLGGGRLTVRGRVRAARLDLQVTGAGTLAIAGIDADAVAVGVIGNGAMTLAGRAGEARLLSNGGGTIAAGSLDAGSVSVVSEGTGETRASARFVADVTNKGLGLVAITGNPKCTVRQASVGPVQCGADGAR